MVAIRPVDQIAAKFVKNAGAAAPDYESGVRQPQEDYARNTVAAAPSYNQGIQASIARSAFQKGVQKAGTAKWQGKSLSKGVARYPTGVADSQQDYQTGFSPYAGVISRITLPQKRAKGDPGNLARVAAIANALRAQKTGGTATTTGGA